VGWPLLIAHLETAAVAAPMQPPDTATVASALQGKSPAMRLSYPQGRRFDPFTAHSESPGLSGAFVISGGVRSRFAA
jgi:hypothetical protein